MSDSVFQLLQNGAKYFEVEFEIQIYTDSERPESNKKRVENWLLQ